VGAGYWLALPSRKGAKLGRIWAGFVTICPIPTACELDGARRLYRGVALNCPAVAIAEGWLPL
jgi:hypothetical protein